MSHQIIGARKFRILTTGEWVDRTTYVAYLRDCVKRWQAEANSFPLKNNVKKVRETLEQAERVSKMADRIEGEREEISNV